MNSEHPITASAAQQMNRSVVEGVFLPGRPAVRAGPVEVLLAAAERKPDRELLRWPGGGRMRVGEFADRALRWATVLAQEGVTHRARVASFCTNSAEFMALQYGTYAAGAVEVPVNSELRGPMLGAILADCEPMLIVVDGDLADIVAEHLPSQARMLVLDEALAARVGAAERAEPVVSEPADLALILYTSGTTGPSKGVMLPHGYLPSVASNWIAAAGVGPADVTYCANQFFHIDAHIIAAMCLMSDSVYGFAKRFSASRFWDDAAEMGSTWFLMVGAMASAIVARRGTDAPRHSFRVGLCGPIVPEVFDYFEDQLGIPMQQIYGQTEAGGVTCTTHDRNRRGSIGWPCMGLDVGIVDEFDEPVPVGEKGRLVYRPREPLLMTYGYWRRPDATAAACRNLWWDSGDWGRLDEEGFVWFEGRVSDSLRRRGENVSAFELESAINAAPGVRASAAVAVPDELGGEDEVKVFLIRDEHVAWDSGAFFAYCERNLPRFAVPRFVELVSDEEFVRSPGNGSIQKHLLPKDNTPGTIDRRQFSGG
jgi:crotonobetaine/carnitine-CoA ligase